MSNLYFVREWKERFKTLCFLPFSNRALKYFPPEFTFRDPVLSLVRHHRNEGYSCGLILFCLEGFHHMMSSYPASLMEDIRRITRMKIKEVLPLYIEEKAIIGVRQFHSDDFCVFIKGTVNLTYDYLNQLSLSIHKEIEKRLLQAFDFQADGKLQLNVASYLIAQEPADTKAAIQIAYHYSYSMAMKKLPPNFCCSREEMHNIISNEEITVLAQPIMNLRSGDVFGWEILTRGPKNSPFHLPVVLFEFAYQADLLTRMESLVIKKALEEISKRNIQEQVFINVTSISLSQPSFLERILKYIKVHSSIEPNQIIFEITERHSIRDYHQIGRLIEKYRAHGFRFAVDDAGAGYSSLQSISELIPDMIKIDKSLIQNIDQASVKQSILKALLYFADHINCQVIAEGVEREEEAEILFQHDVQMGQGYYFAKPEPFLSDNQQGHFEELKNKIKLRLEASSALA